MEAIELLVSRRSCLAATMAEPGPDPAQLELILTAGLRVPDHKKLAPWRIVVVEGPARAALGEVCARAYAADHPDSSAPALAAEAGRATRSPVLLVVASRLEVRDDVPEMEQILSGGAVCMNILNAAHALGFVGQWVTDWPAYHPEVMNALGVEAGDHVLGWIHVGTPTIAPTERPRASVADVVSRWTGPAGET